MRDRGPNAPAQIIIGALRYRRRSGECLKVSDRMTKRYQALCTAFNLTAMNALLPLSTSTPTSSML